MRTKQTSQGLSSDAVAGAYPVLLGFNLRQKDCGRLVGLAILKQITSSTDSPLEPIRLVRFS